MTDGTSVLLFLHLLGGASWLGASIFANLVLVPYVGRRPVAERPDLVRHLVLAPERLVIGSALLAGITGLLLGVAGGRIRGIDDLGTAFGILWMASVVVAIAVFATGGLVTSRAAAQLTSEASGDGVRAEVPPRDAALRRLRVGFAVELVGIVTILALMVALGRS